MELMRITYIVNDYIRVRLSKIEQNARWLLKEHEKRLTERELNMLIHRKNNNF